MKRTVRVHLFDFEALGKRFQAAQAVYEAVHGRVNDAEMARRFGAAFGREFRGFQIDDYRTGARKPDYDVLLGFAKFCGVDPGWLAFGAASQAPKLDLRVGKNAATESIVDAIPLHEALGEPAVDDAESHAETAPHVTHRRAAGQRGKGRR